MRYDARVAPQSSSRNPVSWFVPAALFGVLVLTGLCLHFLSRQLRFEEQVLLEQERISLDQTQELFRRKLDETWQSALQSFPAQMGEQTLQALRLWDRELPPFVAGFALDSSGMFLYPPFQLYPQAPALLSQPRNQEIARSHTVTSNGDVAGTGLSDAAALDTYRRLLGAAARNDRELALSLARTLLGLSPSSRSPDGVPTFLPALVLLLEFTPASGLELQFQSDASDRLLKAYDLGQLFLNAASALWLERLREQCRRRNDSEAWLNRQHRTDRLLRQIHLAERYLPRLNLLLRRHLYNVAKTNLPVQYLTSDLSEDPVLVTCKFVSGSVVEVVGLAIDLDAFSRELEDLVARASWRAPELTIRIQREPSSIPSESLSESRIIDPRAPQYVAVVRPRDPTEVERRSWVKNILYLAIVVFSAGSCVLILIFGQRAVREQHRLAKLRTDFITNVSHELRTPLTAIRLHAETLSRLGSTDQLIASSAGTILEESDRLNLLIADVLEFTRLENDKKRYNWQRVDLVQVIRESLNLFSHQLDEAGFDLNIDLPDNLVLQRADRAALKQTALNLISNSLKFSPDSRQLMIRVTQNGQRAIWETMDKGIGIKPEEQDRIFEKFFRGSELDPAMSGTGLGLTLCKAFVEAHGGTIRVESTAGAGTRFIIELPLAGIHSLRT
ncbi:MAG: HAMP domain-containing sensor histidine kinase [Acidobacteriota bacterium]